MKDEARNQGGKVAIKFKNTRVLSWAKQGKGSEKGHRFENHEIRVIHEKGEYMASLLRLAD